jgi:hypothetical protein
MASIPSSSATPSTTRSRPSAEVPYNAVTISGAASSLSPYGIVRIPQLERAVPDTPLMALRGGLAAQWPQLDRSGADPAHRSHWHAGRLRSRGALDRRLRAAPRCGGAMFQCHSIPYRTSKAWKGGGAWPAEVPGRCKHRRGQPSRWAARAPPTAVRVYFRLSGRQPRRGRRGFYHRAGHMALRLPPVIRALSVAGDELPPDPQ